MNIERYTWRIALFAGLADQLNTRLLEVVLDEPELPAAELKRRVQLVHPAQNGLIASSFVACNQEFAPEEAVVSWRDELALLPPVSGGEESAEAAAVRRDAERYVITSEALDVERLNRLVAHPDHGAALLFVGTTREWTAGSRTVLLEYEAYEPMALNALKKIGAEIAAKWPGALCAIHHRIGRVGVGEASVVIAVSSAHRAAAYEANRYAIERLKTIVPIWKKEVYEDGTEWKGHQLGPWNPVAPAPNEPFYNE